MYANRTRGSIDIFCDVRKNKDQTKTSKWKCMRDFMQEKCYWDLEKEKCFPRSEKPTSSPSHNPSNNPTLYRFSTHF